MIAAIHSDYIQQQQEETAMATSSTTTDTTILADRAPVADHSKYPSRMPRAIFLDSGGVVNDNDRRAPQWVHHLQEYMPTTVLGGPGMLWGLSNQIASHKLFKAGGWETCLAQAKTYGEFERVYGLHWMELACEGMDTLLQAEHARLDKAIATAKDALAVASLDSTSPTSLEKQHQLIERLEQQQKGLAKKLVLPESEDELVAIARAAHLYCTARVKADYPGAVEAILKLKDSGMEMFMCSGETSHELALTFRTLGITTVKPLASKIGFGYDLDEEGEEEGEGEVKKSERVVRVVSNYFPGSRSLEQDVAVGLALEDPTAESGGTMSRVEYGSLSLRPVFTTLYGPDLINQHKSSTRYYELIFQDCGIDPRDAVVLDDKEYILGWAKTIGVTTVMISDKDRRGKELMVPGPAGEEGKLVPAVDYQLSSLAELPALVESWRLDFAREENAAA